MGRRLKTKEVALIACFTALYTCFSFIPTFPIVGVSSKAITLAAITAPIIGIILGSYLGMMATLLGGIIGRFFAAPFSTPSFVSGVAAAVFAGLLHRNKRGVCVFMYFSLMFFFGFYPFVGPVWLYPPFMWFQIIGFLLLVSPLQSMALDYIRDLNNKPKVLSGFFIIFLNSTLTGQIAGSLTFELISWPIFMADINLWWEVWRFLTWLYPIERVIIASITTFIGVFVYRALTAANLIPLFHPKKQNVKS